LERCCCCQQRHCSRLHPQPQRAQANCYGPSIQQLVHLCRREVPLRSHYKLHLVAVPAYSQLMHMVWAVDQRRLKVLIVTSDLRPGRLCWRATAHRVVARSTPISPQVCEACHRIRRSQQLWRPGNRHQREACGCNLRQVLRQRRLRPHQQPVHPALTAARMRVLRSAESAGTGCLDRGDVAALVQQYEARCKPASQPCVDGTAGDNRRASSGTCAS
jgi:hypothetical protein